MLLTRQARDAEATLKDQEETLETLGKEHGLQKMQTASFARKWTELELDLKAAREVSVQPLLSSLFLILSSLFSSLKPTIHHHHI